MPSGIGQSNGKSNGTAKMNGNWNTNIGRRIKFYEQKDDNIDDEKVLFNGGPNIKKDDTSRVGRKSLGKKTSQSDLAVYATINKEEKWRTRKEKARSSSQEADNAKDAHIYQDLSDFQTTTTRQRRRRNKHPNDSEKGASKIFSTGIGISTTDTSTLTADATKTPVFDMQQNVRANGKTSPLERYEAGARLSSMKSDPVARAHSNSISTENDNPQTTQKSRDYESMMADNRNALLELRKSLSNNDRNENPDRTIISTDNTNSFSQRMTTRISGSSNDHEAVSKQDSNTSVISNASTASSLSKKLLSLQEEHEKSLTKSSSNKMKKNSKRFSRKKSLESDFTPDNSQQKDCSNDKERSKINAFEYTQADVSPASIRSNRSLIPHNTSDERKPLNFETKTPDIQLNGDKFLTCQIRPEFDQLRNRSPVSAVTQTSTSTSSSGMQSDTQLVFKVDLDQPYWDKSLEESKLQDIPVSQHEEKKSIETKELRSFLSAPKNERRHTRLKDRDKNSKTQTEADVPTIIAPKSENFGIQTAITPSSSKRLQARPWNLADLLQNKSTQTASNKKKDVMTQIQQRRKISSSSQTKVKTFRTVETQTTIPAIKIESSVQAKVSTQTTETQTPNEDSEVWGSSASVSLDRLIRNGAIKRTQSMGNGIIGNSENSHEPSVSIASVSKHNSNFLQKQSQLSDINSNTETSGKITTYSWNENGKFVKIFISYSGIHLIPSKNIQVKTNGINLHLTVEELISNGTSKTNKALLSSLYLNRLRRPVACLSYNIQRDMITIMLRKQKQSPWNALTFGEKIV